MALIVVSIGAVVASRSVARSQALDDAERHDLRLADLVVGPILGDALQGVEGAADTCPRRSTTACGTAISARSRSGTPTAGSSGPTIPRRSAEQVDRRPRSPRRSTAGAIGSDFEDQPEASEQTFDGSEDGFVEVYIPLEVPGQPDGLRGVLRLRRVDETANGLLLQLMPLVLIPLLVLMLIQVPIAALAGPAGPAAGGRAVGPAGAQPLGVGKGTGPGGSGPARRPDPGTRRRRLCARCRGARSRTSNER